MTREIFKFLASLKLALLLLAVIIVATAMGTYYESLYSADVARRLVYNHWWFDLWLTMLCVNLFSVAAIRYPWKSHQTGFVITHAGIIVLLIGGMIDRHWGIEGSIGLNRGEPPTNIMELRDQEILVFTGDKKEPTRTKINKDSIISPDDVRGELQSGDPSVKVELLDIRPVTETQIAVPVENGVPAVHVTLQNPNFGRMEKWLMFNDPLDMGKAVIEFVAAPAAADPNRKVPWVEQHTVFSKYPEMVTSKPKPAGAKATLKVDDKGENPELSIEFNGKTFKFDVNTNLEKNIELEGAAPWQIFIYKYYLNYVRLSDGKVVSDGNKPENPAVVFDLTGPLVAPPAQTAVAAPTHSTQGSTDGRNAFRVLLTADKKLRYETMSASGTFSGDVELEKPIQIPDWGGKVGTQAFVVEYLPSAKADRKFFPADSGEKGARANQLKDNHAGALCQVTVNGDTQKIWLPQTVPLNVIAQRLKDDGTPADPEEFKTKLTVGGKNVALVFANRTTEMPFTIELEKFNAPFQEGLENSTSFMSFESTLSFDNQNDTVRVKHNSPFAASRHAQRDDPTVLRGAIYEENTEEVKMALGRTDLIIPRSDIVSIDRKTHHIHMNSPTTYPITWYGPWTGTGFKFSQAGHDMPRNPDYSGVQILRDPGWMPKWVGCLMICFGIFTMFYLKPYMSGRAAWKAQEARKAKLAMAQGNQTASEKSDAKTAAAGE